MPVCLSIQSHVVAGHVGHAASAFVLEAAGVEVWRLPTVILSGHAATPGVQGRGMTGAEIAALGQGLAAGGASARVDAVLTGYLGSVEAAEAAAGIVAAVKAARPDAVYLCDPVLGDDGRLYLPEGMIGVYRDRLLPLADIAAPNLDELGWLTGAPVPRDGIAAAARRLGPGTVFVTSVARGEEIGIMAVTAEAASLATAPRVPRRVNGAGDFTAALLLAETLAGRGPSQAAARTVAAAAALAAEARRLGRDDLPVIAGRAFWDAC